MTTTLTDTRPQHVGDLLGLELPGTPALIRAVRRGLPYSAFERLREALGTSAQALAGLVGLPVRTLNKRKHEGRFTEGESDDLVRLARVIGATFAFFEEPDAARAWLGAPERAFDGETPLSLLDTEVGAQEVLQLLGRLEHGVFP